MSPMASSMIAFLTLLRQGIGLHIALKKSTKMANFLTARKTRGFGPSTIRAETLFALFLHEHNLPLRLRLFPAMFPNCKTNKEYSSGRTRSEEYYEGEC